MKLSQITGQYLKQETLSSQLFVTFGSGQGSKPPTKMELIKQEGEVVELTITTPSFTTAQMADVTVRGLDEESQPLKAFEAQGFRLGKSSKSR